MSQATAAISPTGLPKVYVPPSPLLLLDGRPAIDFKTTHHRATAPLDERSAEFVSVSPLRPVDIDRKQAVLTMPIRLADGQTHWPVLASGRLSLADRSSGDLWNLIDDWTTRLSQVPAQVAWQETDGRISLRSPDRAILRAKAGKGNRSAETGQIDNQFLYVLSELDHRPWTLLEALAFISAMADLRLDFRRLPTSIGDWPINADCSLNRPTGKILEQLLLPWGLMIRREMIWQGQGVVEHRFVQPANRGRGIDLGPSWPATEIALKRSPFTSRLWIAQAPGWLVEGTFNLMPGWDRSLQGQPTTRYAKNDPQFADHANVYRSWVLNEDGRFTGEPYGNAQAFSLTGFFASDQAVEPTPIPFQDALTLDDADQRRKPAIEISLDNGITWSPYAGEVSLRNDRAAIYFSDAVLPSDVLAAAIADALRVRVTASLQSPLAVTIRRWQGNPFARTGEAKTLETEAFAFRRVHPSSIHASAISSGQRSADQADDHHAMNRWLLQQMDQNQAMPDFDQTQIRLTLPLVNPLWSVGDRLTSDDLTSRLPELGDQASTPWTIRQLTCRWSASGTGIGMDVTLSPGA